MSKDRNRGSTHPDDTDVGFGRPPKEHRFKKGQVSNPYGCKGKPKPEVDFLDGRQRVVVAGRSRLFSNRELLFRTLFKVALGGNVSAAKLMLDCDRQRQATRQDTPSEETLSPEDQAAFDRLIVRRARQALHAQEGDTAADDEPAEESIE